MPGWPFAFIVSVLAVYGVWALRRDYMRGRASARGFGFDKATRPTAYRVLMTFNCFAILLLVIGSVILVVREICINLISN